jgi:cell division protein FtsQ
LNAPGAASTPLGRRIVSGVAGAIVAALLAWAGWYGFGEVVAQPVKRVVFAGDADRLAPAELARLEQDLIGGSPAPLDAIRAAAQRIPWVREATVRREFPDTIEVTFAAYQAFARWNDHELVSAAGEVFSAPGAGDLPQLRGPAGSAGQVVREYPLVAAALAPVGSELKELALSPRGSWHATLASGLVLALGSGDWQPRARRFAQAWPQLAPEARASRYADLRYPGGFALKRAAEVNVVTKP